MNYEISNIDFNKIRKSWPSFVIFTMFLSKYINDFVDIFLYKL